MDNQTKRHKGARFNTPPPPPPRPSPSPSSPSQHLRHSLTRHTELRNSSMHRRSDSDTTDPLSAHGWPQPATCRVFVCTHTDWAGARPLTWGRYHGGRLPSSDDSFPTIGTRQTECHDRHSTIGTRQTEYHEALPSSANVQSHLTSTFTDDGNAS